MNKGKATVACIVVLIIALIAVFAVMFYNRDDNKSVNIKLEEVESLMIVDKTSRTTKTFETLSDDITEIVETLNNNVKTNEEFESILGEGSVYYAEETIKLEFYANGFKCEENFYYIEDFDFDVFYQNLDKEEIPFER